MSQFRKPSRLHVSQEANVCFLVDTIEHWLELNGTRDIESLLSPLCGESWKTSPKLKTMVLFSGLASDLFTKAPSDACCVQCLLERT